MTSYAEGAAAANLNDYEEEIRAGEAGGGFYTIYNINCKNIGEREFMLTPDIPVTNRLHNLYRDVEFGHYNPETEKVEVMPEKDVARQTALIQERQRREQQIRFVPMTIFYKSTDTSNRLGFKDVWFPSTGDSPFMYLINDKLPRPWIVKETSEGGWLQELFKQFCTGSSHSPLDATIFVHREKIYLGSTVVRIGRITNLEFQLRDDDIGGDITIKLVYIPIRKHMNIVSTAPEDEMTSEQVRAFAPRDPNLQFFSSRGCSLDFFLRFGTWEQVRLSAKLGGRFWKRPDMTDIRKFVLNYRWSEDDNQFYPNVFPKLKIKKLHVCDDIDIVCEQAVNIYNILHHDNPQDFSDYRALHDIEGIASKWANEWRRQHDPNPRAGGGAAGGGWQSNEEQEEEEHLRGPFHKLFKKSWSRNFPGLRRRLGIRPFTPDVRAEERQRRNREGGGRQTRRRRKKKYRKNHKKRKRSRKHCRKSRKRRKKRRRRRTRKH